MFDDDLVSVPPVGFNGALDRPRCDRVDRGASLGGNINPKMGFFLFVDRMEPFAKFTGETFQPVRVQGIYGRHKLKFIAVQVNVVVQYAQEPFNIIVGLGLGQELIHHFAYFIMGTGLAQQ